MFKRSWISRTRRNWPSQERRWKRNLGQRNVHNRSWSHKRLRYTYLLSIDIWFFNVPNLYRNVLKLTKARLRSQAKIQMKALHPRHTNFFLFLFFQNYMKIIASFYRYFKYIRVSYKTDISTMITLLTSRKQWNMKKPELIISVTGGAKLTLKNELKEMFCKGLVKAATTTSTDFFVLKACTNHCQINFDLKKLAR